MAPVRRARVDLVPTVSVVVPTWRGRGSLEACAASVLASSHADLELVVVDNASTDGSVAEVAGRFPGIRVVRNERNRGYPGGCNAGLRVARGEVLVLLNDDVEVERGWVEALIEALADEAVGVAGGKNLYTDGRTVQSAGGRIEWPLGLALDRGAKEADGPQWDRPCTVDFVNGCGLAVRRSVLERVGELDERFWPGYYEDVDLCRRVTGAGLEVRYVPGARLRHAEGRSFRRRGAIWRYHHRSRLRMVLKHTPPGAVLDAFVPAERAFQAALIGTVGAAPLARAYREASAATARGLVRDGVWTADEGAAVVGELLALAAEAVGERSRDLGAIDAEGLRAALAGSQAHLLSVFRAERREVRRRDEELALRRDAAAELRSVRELLGRREAELQAAAAERAAWVDAVAAKDAELGSLRATLAAKEAELSATGRELASVVAARDTEIASLRAVVSARDEELASVVAARDAELGSLRAVVSARDEELGSVKAVLAARDEELAAVKPVLAAREGALASLRGTWPGRAAELWLRLRARLVRS